MMLIPTNLIVNEPEIIRGLTEGTFKLTGGIVRNVQDGTIVRHLATVGDSGLNALNVATGPLLNGATQFNIMQSTLTGVLQASQLAAGASVLGIGVSIAGFAYMAHKLHKIQNALQSIQHTLDQGFGRVESKLDRIADHLVYIELLVEQNRKEQQKLSNDLLDLHKAVFMLEFAKFQAALVHKKRDPSNSTKPALQASTQARLFFASQAQASRPQVAAREMVLTEMASQGWAVATASEAYLLMELGHTDEALDVMNQDIPQLRQNVTRWTDELIKDKQDSLSTAYKFGTEPLKPHISKSRLDRIVDFSSIDKDISEQKILAKTSDAKAELTMIRSKPLLADNTWTHQQVAIAEYLDGLAELTYRLESLQAFAELCHKNGIKNPADILPKEEGVYFIDPQP